MTFKKFIKKIYGTKNSLDEKILNFYCKHPRAFKAVMVAAAFTPLIVSLLHNTLDVAAANTTHDWTGQIAKPDYHYAGADNQYGTSDDYWQIQVKTKDDVTHTVNFYAYDSSIQTIENYEDKYNVNDTIHVMAEDVDGVHCGRSIEMMQDGPEGCYIPVTWAGILSSLGLVKYASRLKKKAKN